MIGLPSQTPGVGYSSGVDGYPAFQISDSAYIRQAARAFFKEKLYDNFAITITLRPSRREGGILFVVKNPYETIVEFGVEISPLPNNKQSLVLYYTQNSRYARTSVKIADFSIPSITNKWSKLAIKVEGTSITLYINCKEYGTKQYDRGNNVLGIEDGSSLYIANGGPNFDNKFVVRN